MVFSLWACEAQEDPVLSVPDTVPGQTEPTASSVPTEPATPTIPTESTAPSISTEPTDPTVSSDPTLPSGDAACEHLFSLEYLIEATCSKPGRTYGVCEYCGEERYDEIPVIPHSFSNATCTQAKTCTVCGVTEGNALGHHYVSGKCDRCGDQLPDEIPAGCAHDYSVSDQKAPTCTATGSITYKCCKCSHLYTETIAANGHKFAEATCETPKTCTICSATSGSALGHSYTGGKCSRCGVADPSVPVEVTYTVTIRTDKGMPVEGVTVSVYTTGTAPAATGKTNSKGTATMTLLSHDSYKIVLSDVPAHYAAKESYTFRSTKVNINLASVSYITPTDHSKANYKVGSTMGDFTLTDTDGISYTLSELLKEKDIVILDFWYTTCAPCKSEFPYFESICDKYGDRIQLLALDPIDSEASIKSLRQELGYTFPMIRENIGLATGFGVIAYPTTVFIDSSGRILKIEVGAFRSEQELTDLIDNLLR